MVHILEQGSRKDKQSIDLYTRKRQRIPNEQRQQRLPCQMKAAQDFILKTTRECKPRSLCSIYNCMGLVFASRRTAIDPEHYDTLIAPDDGYRQIKTEDAKPGDIVVYRGQKTKTVEHVGIIIEVKDNIEKAKKELILISQFGFEGEYIHKSDDVPSNLIDLCGNFEETVWTERI